MFLIDTAQGRIVEDDEIKRSLAEAQPYAEWLEAGVVELGELIHTNLKFEISNFKSPRACVSSATSSRECAAVSVTRSRAAPRATVG